MINRDLAQTGYDSYYQMLSDNIRMNAYKDAIYSQVKKDDVVIDLGSGCGILSVWAIKAGAKKVYSIEKSDAIELAKEIALINGVSDKIIFLNENSKDVEIPEKADVLVSETLGSFAIDENTLEFTFDARDRLLKKNGSMIPFQLDLFACPIQNEGIYNKIDFWRKIPDVDFSPAFELFSKKLMVETIEEDNLLSKMTQMISIDLEKSSESKISARQYFQMKNAGSIHGVAGWFTVYLTKDIRISTSPKDAKTHWKQAFFPFREIIEVVKNDVLDWGFSLESSSGNIDDSNLSYSYRCTQIKNEIPTS